MWVNSEMRKERNILKGGNETENLESIAQLYSKGIALGKLPRAELEKDTASEFHAFMFIP